MTLIFREQTEGSGSACQETVHYVNDRDRSEAPGLGTRDRLEFVRIIIPLITDYAVHPQEICSRTTKGVILACCRTEPGEKTDFIRTRWTFRRTLKELECHG